MMNGQLIELQLPLEVIKSMIFQLPKKEQEAVGKALTQKLPSTKSLQLKGYLKGLVTQEKDFLAAKQSLFRTPL